LGMYTVGKRCDVRILKKTFDKLLNTRGKLPSQRGAFKEERIRDFGLHPNVVLRDSAHKLIPFDNKTKT
jgi:hypothetical protein